MSHYEPTKSEFLRQLLYELKFADVFAQPTMWRIWSSMWELIRFWIAYNILYRYLLNLWEVLYLHWNWQAFEWPRLNFPEYAVPPLLAIEKGRYGYTRYGYCVYDPEALEYRNAERAVWDMRYKVTKAQAAEYNYTSQTLKQHFTWLTKVFEDHGWAWHVPAAIEDMFAEVEGKLLNAAYVGFTLVGLGKVCAPKHSLSKHVMRDWRDWKTEVEVQTTFVFENHVGFSRVGYARVITPTIYFKKDVSDLLVKLIDDFCARAEPLARAVFYIQKSDDMKREGSRHQGLMQIVINRVKDLLNKRGVFGILRRGYIGFAMEYMYYLYKGHRRYKRYKAVLTEDEIMEKYIRMGLDADLLREIAWIVKSLQQKSP